MHYYEEVWKEHRKILIIGAIIGALLDAGIIWITYKNMFSKYSVLENILGYGGTFLFFSFAACSIVNLFDKDSGRISAVTSNIARGGWNICWDMIVGGYALFSSGSTFLLVLVPFILAFDLLVLAIYAAIFAVTWVICTVTFWVECIYYFIRYMIEKKNGGTVEAVPVEDSVSDMAEEA